MSAPMFVPHPRPPAVEYSIWGTATEGTAAVDGSPGVTSIVVGTKFRADSAGSIVGIRWQRSSVGQPALEVALFSGTTNISGTRTITGQTASGWQRMDFASPVAIAANTIYTAATRYNITSTTDIVYYSASAYFATARINGPLEAVANSVSSNGIYLYSTTMAAPTEAFNESYFIDVVFIN